MGKDRLEPCVHYVCKGECEIGRDADHKKYCQKCKQYKPRTYQKHINKKKRKLEKAYKSEMY